MVISIITDDQYLELSLCHKVCTEKRAGQQARSNNDVLSLVEKGQACLGLPLRHLKTGGLKTH